MTYYQILGVHVTATVKDIQKAYRKLAKQYHPDTNPDNPEGEEILKKINEAYETLINEEKRELYNQKIKTKTSQGQKRYQRQESQHRQKRERRKSRTRSDADVNVEQFLNKHRDRLAKRQFEMNTWEDFFGLAAVLIDDYIRNSKG